MSTPARSAAASSALRLLPPAHKRRYSSAGTRTAAALPCRVDSLRSFFKPPFDHFAETRLGLLHLPIHASGLVRLDLKPSTYLYLSKRVHRAGCSSAPLGDTRRRDCIKPSLMPSSAMKLMVCSMKRPSPNLPISNMKSIRADD